MLSSGASNQHSPEGSKSIPRHGTALLDLAQVLALLGDGSPPPDVVAEALSLFERKQDAASLRRAATVFAGVPLAS